jgi:hypothetical protein
MIKNFFTKEEYCTGLLLDEAEYKKVPVKKIENAAKREIKQKLEVSPVVSLKQYAPRPGHQGKTHTCATWAAVYTAQTIMMSIRLKRTDEDLTTRNALSPAFVYCKSFDENPNWYNDDLKILKALEKIKDIGSPKMSEWEMSHGITNAPISQYERSRKFRIKDYWGIYSTNEEKVFRIKFYIATAHPVIVALKVPESFKIAKEYWKIKRGESPEKNYKLHGVCIIGFDENRKAFEIQNSWGVDWGNNGCTWVNYDTLAEYTVGAFYMEDNEDNYQLPAEYKGKIDVKLFKGTSDKPHFKLIENGYYRTTSNYRGEIKFRFSFNINLTLRCYIFTVKGDMSNLSPVFPLGEGPLSISQGIDDEIPREGRWLNTETDGDIFVLFFSRSDKFSLGDIQRKFNENKKDEKLTCFLNESMDANFVSFYHVKYEPHALGYTIDITEDSDIFCMIISVGRS